MLPPEFGWTKLDLSHLVGAHCVVIGGVGVALVAQTVQGQWFAAANYHRLPHERPTVLCTSLDQGIACVEEWVMGHAEELRKLPETLSL